jgi:hypothetical protein
MASRPSTDLPPQADGTLTPPAMVTYQVSRVTLSGIAAGRF